MRDIKVEGLKKRLRVDVVCCFMIAIVQGILAMVDFWVFATLNRVADVDILEEAVRALVISVSFVLLSLIMVEINKDGKPFSKGIILKLRVLAVWIMVGAYIPNIAVCVAEFVKTSVTTVLFNIDNVFVLLLGATIAIISEIFVYGYELQEEMDSIA